MIPDKRKERKKRREKKTKRCASIRRLFLPPAFDQLSLSLFISPAVFLSISRAHLPFSPVFFLYLRRYVGVDVGEVSLQSRQTSTDPDKTSRKSRWPSGPSKLSIDTSLPIQFYGGRSPRIPSQRQNRAWIVRNTSREISLTIIVVSSVRWSVGYARIRLTRSVELGPISINLRKQYPDSRIGAAIALANRI